MFISNDNLEIPLYLKSFMLNDNYVTYQALPGIVALCMKYHDLSGYVNPPDLAATCVKPSQTASEESARMFFGGL